MLPDSKVKPLSFPAKGDPLFDEAEIKSPASTILLPEESAVTRCLSVAGSATLVRLGPSALKRPSSAATKFRFAKSCDRSP
jgi:hypothetical protein